MKKALLAVAFLVGFAALSNAQLFEAVGNPIVVAGGSYQLEKPDAGNRAAFMLSANIAGVKVGSLPVYFGGIGASVPTTISDVASQFGNFIQLTVPAVTWYPAGNKTGTLAKICAQVGYTYVLSEGAQARSGVYVGVGYAWNSPAFLKYKREVKKAKLKGVKPGAAEYPKNPYDVK